jgi:maltose O-acetyltransferase
MTRSISSSSPLRTTMSTTWVRTVGRLGGLRRDQPSVWRVLIIERLICSELLPSALVYLGLRAVGYDLSGPCGLRGARIETDRLQIGSKSWVNRGLRVEGRGPVSIGHGVLMGPQVLIATSTHERGPDGQIRLEATYLPVRIGDRCWIGARAQILGGVVVGNDVTVAAGAVVVADIGPGGLYGGVPARRIK